MDSALDLKCQLKKLKKKQAEKLWFKHYSILAKIQIALDINLIINLTKDINKEQVNRTFLTVKEVLKQSNRQNVIFTEANTSQIPLKSNNQVEIEMKPMQLQELLESGILANTYLHIKLS
uniref:Uncharacterized protein n=1 Tax=Rhizophagus irregularis (strain DAOM 181602 / DAOM 197198 / MUCL 43194) TaxID=747089 RepID=U9SGN2_RHIID